jgi:hypothetical protein
MARPSISRPSISRPSVSRPVMRTSALSARLSPDELRKLAERQMALAGGTEPGPERLRILTMAETLIDLAEAKKLLRHYERRLLNQARSVFLRKPAPHLMRGGPGSREENASRQKAGASAPIQSERKGL